MENSGKIPDHGKNGKFWKNQNVKRILEKKKKRISRKGLQRLIFHAIMNYKLKDELKEMDKMQTINGKEVKILGSFPHPVTGQEMAVVEYLNGIQTTVKGSNIEEVSEVGFRANRLIQWLTANGIVVDVMVSGDNECISFEHFPRSFNEYVSVEVTEGGYTVGTCKAGEDADKNARTIKKEATMIKWLEKRIG